MIVRNEAHVIRRCLSSVLPIVDHWVIIDTGSTDETQEIVRDCVGALPGTLIQRPWVDFGHNRTELLEYARGQADYVLVIDADETLEISEDFSKAALTADAHKLESRYGRMTYVRTQILRSSLPWKYVGKVHEYPACDTAWTEETIPGLRVNVRHDGARARDPNTYRRDALLLQSELIDDPTNARTVFYLAQSYRDAGDLELAIRYYRQRADMGGWLEEVWFSLYQIALLRDRMECPWGTVLEEYLAAVELQPDRAEPLYRIGMYYQHTGAHRVAQMFLAQAMAVPYPGSQRLFVDKDMYDWRLPLEYAAACSYAGDYHLAIATCNRLLRGGELAAEHIEQVIECRRTSLTLRSPHPGTVERTHARIRVCVPFQDPDAAFDDCIESITRQTSLAFDITLIDDGSHEEQTLRIPSDDPRVRVLRNEQPLGFAGCINRFVTEQCAPDDIVIPLAHRSRFVSTDIMRGISAAFADDHCIVLYGQHRLASGEIGDAEPAADDADFANRGAAVASGSPLIFRARLWREHVSPYLAEAPAANAPWDALLRAAGLHGTRFTDAVHTVVSDAVTPTAPVRLITSESGASPTVSCLMVTHDRLALAKRAIRCFANQTYHNRELVIVTDGTLRFQSALARFVVELELERVRIIPVAREGASLGELRNLSLAAAEGDIVCQWDDDDCYHPDRIRFQVEHMLANDGRACFLTEHFQFLEDDRALVWIDWTLGGKSGRDQLLPGTLVMFNDARFRYPESGPYAQRGEDSMLLNDLCDNVPVIAARGMGHLYLYTYHGRNTFDRQHHYQLGAFSFSVADLEAKRDVIRAAMMHYPVARPFVVIGRDGPAFTLND
jgi:glycosyltransferase involved in cell wall biosynthesis